jgi:hypothetical protein
MASETKDETQTTDETPTQQSAGSLNEALDQMSAATGGADPDAAWRAAHAKAAQAELDAQQADVDAGHAYSAESPPDTMPAPKGSETPAAPDATSSAEIEEPKPKPPKSAKNEG